MRLCETPGCGRKHYAHGLCQTEYLAKRRSKTPDALTQPLVAPTPRPPDVQPRLRDVQPPASVPARSFLAAGSIVPADGPAAVIVNVGSVDL